MLMATSRANGGFKCPRFRAMVFRHLFSEVQMVDGIVVLRIVAESPRAFDSLLLSAIQQQTLTIHRLHPATHCRSPSADVLRALTGSGPCRHPADDFNGFLYQRHPASEDCGIGLRSSWNSVVAS